jgi:hypothetical protein
VSFSGEGDEGEKNGEGACAEDQEGVIGGAGIEFSLFLRGGENPGVGGDVKGNGEEGEKQDDCAARYGGSCDEALDDAGAEDANDQRNTPSSGQDFAGGVDERGEEGEGDCFLC